MWLVRLTLVIQMHDNGEQYFRFNQGSVAFPRKMMRMAFETLQNHLLVIISSTEHMLLHLKCILLG